MAEVREKSALLGQSDERTDTRPSKMLILSDDPIIKNLATRKLPHATHLSYAGLMKANNVTRLFDDVKLF